MRARSLHTELTRASLITTLLALLLTAGSLFFYQMTTYRDALANDARAQAQLIAHTTAAALVFDDRAVAQQRLDLLQLKPSMRAGAIFRLDGTPFVTYTRGESTIPPLARDRGLEALSTRFDGRLLDVAWPIRSDGEIVGVVYLQAEHDVWWQAIAYAGILLVVSLISLSIAYVVFNRLQQRVTSTLMRVTRVAEQVMNSRDWSLRAPESRNLDVAVLVRAFNGMLDEVQQRTDELEGSNDRLARETQERRNAEEELKRLDRRKDEFIATLAHELRNPLAPMMNASALLRVPNAPEPVRNRAVTIVDRQLRHMARLIDDLLDVSRIITGKLSLQRETLDLATLASAAVDLAGPMYRQHGQRLDFHPSPRPVRVSGDAARLNQVMANLLNNASQYSPPESTVEVRIGVEDGQAFASIRDQGIGIDPSMKERLFDLFEQADKSLERGNAGLGIGLTLARQIMQLHGGSLTVESEGLGKGSCFTLRLPVLADAPFDEPLAREPDESTRQALDVLVADDNEDYAQSLGAILQSMGHSVRVVHDGLAAVEAASQSVPDVALLDIGMPKLNGYDVARRLRSRHAAGRLRLVAVTGWGQTSDRKAATEAGFDAHLIKPVPIEVLVAALGG